jgi:hypothetical protein
VTIFPYRMHYLDEVRGPLTHIELIDIGLLAHVGQISVLLPPELINRLQGCMDREIGILRAGDQDYRIKFLDGAHA